MNKALACRFQSLDWNKTLHIVLAVALLLPLIALRPMSDVAPRTQPLSCNRRRRGRMRW